MRLAVNFCRRELPHPGKGALSLEMVYHVDFSGIRPASHALLKSHLVMYRARLEEIDQYIKVFTKKIYFS